MKNLKKKIFTTLLMTAILSIGVFAKTPTITLNNKEVKSEVAPFIENDRTYVPIRFVAEALKYKVDWDSTNKLVTIKDNTNKIELTINKKEVKINDETKNIDVAPMIKNERTFVPLRFIAESFNIDVKWDNVNYKVILTDKEKSENLSLTQDERNFLNELQSRELKISQKVEDLKTQLFEKEGKKSKEELEKIYKSANDEIIKLAKEIKDLKIPDKFKSAYDYSIKANDKILEVLPTLKEALINDSEETSKKAVSLIADLGVKLTEAKESLDAAITGKEYTPQKDIKVYNDTKNILEDSTIKNLMDKVSK